jgi:hypothetical protein
MIGGEWKRAGDAPLHRTLPIVIGETKACFKRASEIILSGTDMQFQQLQIHLCISKISCANQS